MATLDISDQFGKDFEELKGDEAVRAAVLKALGYFLQHDWNRALPELYSAYGDDYGYRCHPQYVITFALEKKDKQVVIKLNTIQQG